MGSGAYRQPGWATGSVAPRLLGDLLGDTFRVYGSRFEVFFLIALVPQIPTFIGTLISMPAAFSIILSLVGLVIGVVATGATAFAVAGQYLQRPMSVGDCYGRAWGRVVSLVGSSIVFFIALAISVLLVVIVIGIPLFFYVLVRWFFYAPAVILEGKKGPLESLRRSRELVRGSWWRVFGIGIVFVITLLIIGVVATIPASIATGFSPTAAAVLGTIAGTIVTPIGYIGITLVYFDLRTRKEGYRTETLASEVGV